MKQKTYFILMLMLVSMIASTSVTLAATTGGSSDINFLLLNQDPDPAEPGRFLELRWKVTNDGTDILKDVTFKLEPAFPFKLDESENAIQKISSLGSTSKDNYYVLYYRVYVDPEALEGEYDLDLAVTTNSITTYQTFTIRVDNSQNPELVTGIIKTEPSKLMPDTTDNKLSVELLNVGVDDAELVVATLALPKGFENTYSYSSISSLGTIAGGSSKLATFYIDVNEDITEDSYPAIISIKYREEGETTLKTKDIPIMLEIKNKPMFVITNITYEPTVISAGDTVTMKVNVLNVGSKDSESISLRAFKESSQPFNFDEKSDFIGTLKPGQQGTAVIVFDVDADAASKEYLMDLEIRSIYNGDVFTQQDIANVDVLAKKTGFISRYWLAIVGVLAAIIIVIYLTLKKK